MTKFVDLHLCAPFRDSEKLRKMVTKSFELGYRLVGIPLPPNVGLDEVERLRKICYEAGLDLVSRVDLTPKSLHELLASLRRLRRKFEVVSVLCTSKPIARQAAKDRRVDVLSFPVAKPRSRFFDSAEAELASESSSSLEIDIGPLLSLEGFLKIRLISSFRREVAIAKSFRVPVVISSGTTNDYLLRSPHDYSALTMLFDMNSSLALNALSEVPLRIVERNRLKLSPDFVAPGLRVVRRRDP
jgi:ribonuclease P/MRP protein subunit RPP1